MKSQPRQDWTLLIHQLPPRPTNLRVRIWRQLQKLGAVAIKNSVYVLPANEKTNEDFQWLKQQIESAGGEAAVFRADSVEGATDQEIVAAFNKARDEEFAVITGELEALTRAIREQTRGQQFSPGRLAAHEAELDKLHLELQRISANDFFNAKGSVGALNGYVHCEKAIRATRGPAAQASRSSAKSSMLDPAGYQGRRWVTRRNLHIDRLASAWLIKQFIDKRPRFYFVAEGETIEGAIPFDMFGAEFTHHGEDCTFETLLKWFSLSDIKGLRELAEIVHDIDLRDDRFHRLEAAGLNAVINGLSEILRDDRRLLQQTGLIFDGLFELLGKRAEKKPGKKMRRPNQRHSRSKKPPKK